VRTGCLIADICIPGMSGLDLQSKLVRDHYRFPIIFITAQGDEKIRMQALRAGAVEFLVSRLTTGCYPTAYAQHSNAILRDLGEGKLCGVIGWKAST
jgi:DNA-binding NarL/FixJ family response regulator